MRGNVLGVERRRRWSEERKLSIISEVGVGGASVAQVAQRREITRQQIYAWRHELRRKGLWSVEDRPVFLPLEFQPAPEARSVVAPVPSHTSIEIVLRNGRQLRIPSGLGDDALARLIRLVEAA